MMKSLTGYQACRLSAIYIPGTLGDDPCFEWSLDLALEGEKPPKSRTFTGSRYIYTDIHIHPGRLAWNIIIGVWKSIFLSKWVICMFHLNLPGCTRKKSFQVVVVFTIFFHVSQTFLKRTFNFDQVTVGAMPEAPVTGPWGGMAAVGPTEAAWCGGRWQEDDRKYVDIYIYIYIHLEPSMCFPESLERWWKVSVECFAGGDKWSGQTTIIKIQYLEPFCPRFWWLNPPKPCFSNQNKGHQRVPVMYILYTYINIVQVNHHINCPLEKTSIIKGSLVANFRYTNFWVAWQEQ